MNQILISKEMIKKHEGVRVYVINDPDGTDMKIANILDFTNPE